MKISEIIQETASGGSTSSGAIATNVVSGGTPPKGQFFGGSFSNSIYNTIKKNRKARKFGPTLISRKG